MTVLDPEPIPLRPRVKPRVKKLRLLLILVPLALLAIVSTLFGMMMAVASDLPSLEKENFVGRNSVILDAQGRRLGVLTNNQSKVFVQSKDISSWMKFAVISIEDKRFYTNSGVDLRGIGRAFVNDLLKRGGRQGGSTITQQFVKNALEAQDKRTVLQKMREAALAYHLSRKWSKDKVLTQYLNTIYFGNGAYGVESAARTYFAADHVGADGEQCGLRPSNPCAKLLQPWEAAMLAGVISNPTAFDPLRHPQAAITRRNVVLANMRDQGKITPAEYAQYVEQAGPAKVQQPEEHGPTDATPYFTTWVRQSIVDRLGAQQAFEGGLKIRTTLDLDFQKAAEQAVRSRFPAGSAGPTAALVAISNKTGEVRAMVGGADYNQAPFNLATQGQRQPGSSFKPFVLAQALKEGIGPGSVWPSRKREFVVPNSKGKEFFVVNNFEGAYSGESTLTRALTYSDNSVFAAVGIKVGTKKIAKLAQRMGIRTPVSTNYAITLGGLKQGVTPLDMAHAYETIATGGERVTGTLGAAGNGPVGIDSVTRPDGHKILNTPVRKRILSPGNAATETQMMATVITQGTARHAAVNEFAAGKTGTTEDYGDAWFVGFTKNYTVAVWVGYPDKVVSMAHDYHGGPVEGGTYPAEIWHDFMTSVERINGQRQLKREQDKARKDGDPVPQGTISTGTPAPVVSTPATTVPAGTGTTPREGQAPAAGQDGTGAAKTGGQTKAPTPVKTPKPTPATPTPATPAPTGGGDTGAGTGGGAAAPTGR